MVKVMLAKNYEKGMPGSKKDDSKFKKPPIGWKASEKFDGYRALFCYDKNGNPVFFSRTGKQFFAPEWFLQTMPQPKLLKDKILDGELWAGRERFEKMGTVRKKVPVPEEWIDIQYVVYDITNSDKVFRDRIQDLKKIVRISTERWELMKNGEHYEIEYPYNNVPCPIQFTPQKTITSIKKMEEYYKSILAQGGEGIMIKHPECAYEDGRSSNLLKYKPSFDYEAKIIGWKKGNGKYRGKLGGFICQRLINHDTYMTVDEDEDHEFTLSGMDDSIRENYEETHPIGTIITFECSGFTDKGVPRFGRYLRKRTDVVIKEHDSNSSQKLKQIISIFEQIETTMKNNKDYFKAKAYGKVIPGLKELEKDTDLTEENYNKIPGLGKGLKEKIRMIIDTGTCPDYDYILKHKNRLDLKDLFMKIHGVGPNCADKLISQGFKSIEDLRNCKDIKKHLNDVQLMGLRWYDDIQERIPFKEIQKHEKLLKKVLKKVDPKAELTISGSYRRKKPTSGDIDLLLKSENDDTYDRFIDSLKDSEYLVEDLARGPKKYMGMCKGINSKWCRRIDIMYTPVEEYPFAVLYFTGSKEFNVKMRNYLLENGYTLNEHGVEYTDKNKKFKKVFNTEKDIFDYFKYEYVEPHLR